MNTERLEKALKELLRRTREGEVQWDFATKETVRARIGSLWVVVMADGKVKMWKTKEIDTPPWKTHAGRFSFRSDVAQDIYVAARAQDPPETPKTFIKNMLGD